MTRPTTDSAKPRTLRRWLGAGVCATLLTVAGCAGGARNSSVAVYDIDSFAFADDLMTPVVRGGSNGLEVVWFIAFDDQKEVASALSPFVHQPLPVDADTLARWDANGVRLVRVPLDDFNTLASTLELSGLRQRQWLGWALDWREAFRGRSINRGSAFVLDGVRQSSGGGATRFLARTWTTPTLDGTRVRIELAAQLEAWGARRGAAHDPFDLSPGATGAEPLDELEIGEVFASLTLDAAFEPGYAYVVTAEEPGVRWGADASEADDLEQGPHPVARDPFGPPVALPLTIGEAMLTNLPVASHERRARVVLAFIPRAPEQIRLLP